MLLRINPRSEDRVREAVQKRSELLRMWTRDMPADFEDQLAEADRIIAAAVSVSIREADAANDGGGLG